MRQISRGGADLDKVAPRLSGLVEGASGAVLKLRRAFGVCSRHSLKLSARRATGPKTKDVLKD